jgi:hypothetical protein
MASDQPVPPQEPPRGHALGTGWDPAPLLAAADVHHAVGHRGETITCKDPACRRRVDAALADEFEALPVVQRGRLFPG